MILELIGKLLPNIAIVLISIAQIQINREIYSLNLKIIELERKLEEK